ncbi:MAG: ABC transporter permease [Acidimicrobiales bacterium]
MRFARDTMLITRRLLRSARRNPGPAYITPTIIPLALIGIISQVFGVSAGLPGFPVDDFVDWMLPGMVIMTGMFGAGVTAVGLIGDHGSGYLDRLRLLPVSPASVLAGTALFDAVRTVPPALAVLGVGLALGAPLSAGPLGGAALVAVAVLWSLTWNGLFLLVGLRTLDEQAVQALVPLFLPVWWTSSVLLPEHLMPGWIAAISRVNPISLLVDAVRPLAVGGGVDGSDVLVALAVISALLVALQWSTARLYLGLVRAS